MKKNLIVLPLCFLAFGLGFSVNNCALSNVDNKIAVVDIQKLASASATVQNARKIREHQTKEMLNLYDSVSSEIQKQQTEELRQSLIKKYEAQLNQKKTSIQNSYTKELEKADNQISSVISQQANKSGYSIVLRKDGILFGGEDITSSILPYVK